MDAWFDRLHRPIIFCCLVLLTMLPIFAAALVLGMMTIHAVWAQWIAYAYLGLVLAVLVVTLVVLLPIMWREWRNG
jgi:hypothetical protein